MDRGALDRRADTSVAQRLVGSWDVRLDLERSPVLTTTNAVGSSVRGRLAFLANRTLATSYPRIATPANYGTYALDFTPFGFAMDEGQPPTAVAGWRSRDSVEILLDPVQSRVALAMRGKWAHDSIVGAWSVSIAHAGAGGGRFVMSRRAEP